MKFAILSDLHYISDSTLHTTSDMTLRLRAALAKQALKQASELDGIDTIIITGDLTNDGDRESTVEMQQLLYNIKSKGKRVFVLTATHDFHHHESHILKYSDSKVKFKAKPWKMPYFDPEKTDFKLLAENPEEMTELPEFAEATYYSELWSVYHDFGPTEAISLCESEQAYCIALDEDTWCLMLNDSFRNEEALFDKSPTFSPKCLRYISDTIKQAKERGKFIFACTHHPMVAPSPGYRVGADNRNMRSSYTGHLLADMGINLIFTGHSHFCDVSFMSSDKGNVLCDITTSSTGFYPPRFRVVELDGKSTKIKLDSVHVDIPNGFNLDGLSTEEYFEKAFREQYKGIVNNLPSPLNQMISKLKVKHLCSLIRKSTKLSNGEYLSIKEKYVFDIILDLLLNFQAGDGKYTPDTAEYKFMMGLSATLDSIISAQPFVDVKKYLKGYTIAELINPLLFNNSIPDEYAEFDFSVMPKDKQTQPTFSSHAGQILMAIVWAICVPLSFFAPIAVSVGLPIATALKIKKEKLPSKWRERY